MSVLTSRRAAVFVLGLGFLSLAPHALTQDANASDAAALRAFGERVNAYAALHRRLEAPLPAASTLTEHGRKMQRTFLAAAIRAARPQAREGNVFTPEVARYFRALIANGLANRDVEAFLQELYHENPVAARPHPKVHDAYPDWATQEMPAVLLMRFPALPEDIEYRLLDHDLLLWDIHADLIIDVLPDAIVRPTR